MGKHGRVSVMFARPAVQTWDHVCGESECRRPLKELLRDSTTLWDMRMSTVLLLCPREEEAPSPHLGTVYSRFSEHKDSEEGSTAVDLQLLGDGGQEEAPLARTSMEPQWASEWTSPTVAVDTNNPVPGKLCEGSYMFLLCASASSKTRFAGSYPSPSKCSSSDFTTSNYIHT